MIVNTHAFQDSWTYTMIPTILLDRKMIDGFMEGASANSEGPLLVILYLVLQKVLFYGGKAALEKISIE